jgi:hypothetical protein
MTPCPHFSEIRKVSPRTRGCEECLKTGGSVAALAPVPHVWARGVLRFIAE